MANWQSLIQGESDEVSAGPSNEAQEDKYELSPGASAVLETLMAGEKVVIFTDSRLGQGKESATFTTQVEILRQRGLGASTIVSTFYERVASADGTMTMVPSQRAYEYGDHGGSLHTEYVTITDATLVLVVKGTSRQEVDELNRPTGELTSSRRFGLYVEPEGVSKVQATLAQKGVTVRKP